jgi:D-cysteine desulfhydrase
LFIVMNEADCCSTKHNACSVALKAVHPHRSQACHASRLKTEFGRSCSVARSFWSFVVPAASKRARRPCLAAEFDDGGLHRHFLPAERFLCADPIPHHLSIASAKADRMLEPARLAEVHRMDLARFPRRRYTHAPTPIELLPHFTKALAASCPGGVGPEIWIKRDDLLGLFPGGNKTRKLEFLAADALAQGADTLITCGAPQSNHCRITLSAAIKEGLKCRFVIEERVPGSYKKEASGNNFMFELMGVEAITVVPGGSDMGAAMSKVAQEVASLGRKGYVIPGGGSNAIGGLGYVACVQEMQEQWSDMGLALDAVVVGSGSSGTHGGMVAGFFGNHIKIPLIGIGVSRDPADQEPLVLKEAQAVADLLGIGAVPREAVKSFGGYWQPKYSVPNAKMVEAVQILARTEGILLDPVYTGKIMAGLIGLARQGHFKPNAKVLFMHTGGLPSLHVYEDVVLGRTELKD